MSDRTSNDGWRTKRPRTEPDNFREAPINRKSYEELYDDWHCSVTDSVVTEVPKVVAGVLALPLEVVDSMEMWVKMQGGEMPDYGDADCNRSLMEHLYVSSFKHTSVAGGLNICEDVFCQLHNLMQEVRAKSEPSATQGGSDYLIVRQENVIAIAKLIHVVCSQYAEIEDLDLVWRLFENAWCTTGETDDNRKALESVFEGIEDEYGALCRAHAGVDHKVAPFNRRLL